MSLTLLAFAIPAALFLFLVLLPKGRPALMACLVAAALLLCLWGAHYLDVLGLRAGSNNRAQVIAFFMLLGLTLAWFMASSMQVLRRRFPEHWPAWSWPAVSIVALVVIGFGIYRMLTL